MPQMSISTHIHFREVEALFLFIYIGKKSAFFNERYETENIT